LSDMAGAAPTPAGGWAASGLGSGNASYRTQTLKYEPIELHFDESVSLRTLFRLWLSAFIASFLVWVVFFILWLVTGGPSSGSDNGFGSTGMDTSVLNVGSIIGFLVFWLVLLFSRIPEDIAEWRTLLEDKAAAATSAYAAIFGALKPRRQIPVGVVAARIRSDVLNREVVNNRLVISDRGYVAYVSVFEYGTSLYVGWMMWRNRPGWRLIGQYLKDVVGGMFGRTGTINQMLRTEKARAMREAVHSAVREGVEVAVRGIEVPMLSTFGQDIPIQDLTAPSYGANAPGPAPAPGYGPGPAPAFPAQPGPVSAPPAPELPEPGRQE
jgi:hypothetical protein